MTRSIALYAKRGAGPYLLLHSFDFVLYINELIGDLAD